MKDKELLVGEEEIKAKKGLLIATDKRVIKNKKGLWFGQIKDINYDQLSGVSTGRSPYTKWLIIGLVLLTYTLISNYLPRMIGWTGIFTGIFGFFITIIGLMGEKAVKIYGPNTIIKDRIDSPKFIKRISELKIKYKGEKFGKKLRNEMAGKESWQGRRIK